VAHPTPDRPPVTIAIAVSWMENRSKQLVRHIGDMPPGSVSPKHHRARMCLAKLLAVQAGALRHGYRFPEITE